MKQALIISLKVLAVDIPLLLVLGIAIGWILAKKKFRGRETISLLVLLPVALPPSVIGLYLLLLIGHFPLSRNLGLLFSFPAAALAALIPSLPIMIQGARSGFASVPVELEDAARTLGDGEWRVFRRITLALSRRALIAGLTLASARALGDFGVTLMIAGNIPGTTQTLPLFIYSKMESLDFAKAHIAALLLAVIGIISLALVKSMEKNKHERLA